MQGRGSERGQTLLEVIVVLAITAILAQMAAIAWLRFARRLALRAAAVRLEKEMVRIQFDALAYSSNRGLRFWPTPAGWQYAVYEDSDGDGVLNADIASGVDFMVEPPVTLTGQLSIATIGIPEAPVPDPDTGLPFPSSTSPVNFNQSWICSFAPNGNATPGTVYLVNGTAGEAAMVRSSGSGGNIRSSFYGFGGSGWKP
jgi:prepilin-type N-terminal cleavage/methylation domain-containing protein